MLKSGDVVLASIQFTDTFEIKRRPCLVLFEEFNNLVVAGITSNTKMHGIALSKKDGAIRDSVIRLNYIFTISSTLVQKKLFHLPKEKKRMVFEEMEKRLGALKAE